MARALPVLHGRERPANLVVLLREAYLRLNDLVLVRLAEQGHGAVRPAHAAVFQYLDDTGTTVSLLAERARMTKQAMAELVRHLETHGYVRGCPTRPTGAPSWCCRPISGTGHRGGPEPGPRGRGADLRAAGCGTHGGAARRPGDAPERHGGPSGLTGTQQESEGDHDRHDHRAPAVGLADPPAHHTPHGLGDPVRVGDAFRLGARQLHLHQRQHRVEGLGVVGEATARRSSAATSRAPSPSRRPR